MIKHLFCILSLAFLLAGVGHISSKDMQGFRNNSGVPVSCISSYAVSSADSSFENPSQSDSLSSILTIFSETAKHHAFGILTVLTIPNTTMPVKTLRFNSISTIVHLLSSKDASLSENRWKNLFSDTNYLKYSNKYYIYTLSHILI